jgi:hypothetical protein
MGIEVITLQNVIISTMAQRGNNVVHTFSFYLRLILSDRSFESLTGDWRYSE